MQLIYGSNLGGRIIITKNNNNFLALRGLESVIKRAMKLGANLFLIVAKNYFSIIKEARRVWCQSVNCCVRRARKALINPSPDKAIEGKRRRAIKLCDVCEILALVDAIFLVACANNIRRGKLLSKSFNFFIRVRK